MPIQNKVIISLINNREVLLSEGYDPVRNFRFFRPIGGSVEFGEPILDSALRELKEELGLENQKLDFMNFHESIFEFEGNEHHEMVFHFSCNISDEARLAMPNYGVESNGDRISIDWYTREQLRRMQSSIVPPGAYKEINNVL